MGGSYALGWYTVIIIVKFHIPMSCSVTAVDGIPLRGLLSLQDVVETANVQFAPLVITLLQVTVVYIVTAGHAPQFVASMLYCNVEQSLFAGFQLNVSDLDP